MSGGNLGVLHCPDHQQGELTNLAFSFVQWRSGSCWSKYCELNPWSLSCRLGTEQSLSLSASFLPFLPLLTAPAPRQS